MRFDTYVTVGSDHRFSLLALQVQATSYKAAIGLDSQKLLWHMHAAHLSRHVGVELEIANG